MEHCPTNAVSAFGWPPIYTFNAEGEVNNTYNGEWELDPDHGACGTGCPVWPVDCNPYPRPVFATCKNTCPGGETETAHINSL